MHLQIRKASHSGIDPEAVPSAATTVGAKKDDSEQTHEEAQHYIKSIDADNSINDQQVRIRRRQRAATAFASINPSLHRMIRWDHQAPLRAAADHIDRAFTKAQRNLTELAGLNEYEFQADERAKQPAVGSNKIGVKVS